MPSETILYPESLPFLNIGWSMEPSDNIIRSQPERGPSKTRRKSTAKTKTYSGTIAISSQQLDTFLHFAEDTIADCSRSFFFPDYMTNEMRKARITSYTIKQITALSYEVSIKIEVLP